MREGRKRVAQNLLEWDDGFTTKNDRLSVRNALNGGER